MTRIVQCGWETGDVAQHGTPYMSGTSSSVTVVNASPAPPGLAAYCLKCGLSTGGNTAIWAVVTERLSADKTDLYFGFSMYRDNAAASLQTTGNTPALILQDASSNVNFLLTVDWDGTVKAWYQGSGGNTTATASMVLIDTADTLMPLQRWVDFELHVTAATAATGTVELKMNGLVVLSVVGTARTCQTSATFRTYHLGYRRTVASGVALEFFAFDNFRINDTAGSANNSWPGMETIRMMLPSAAGDLTALTRGGTDSGANWSQVDERPPTAGTDYVYGTAVGNTDLYNTANMSASIVSCVNVVAQVFNGDGSGGSVNVPTKTGAGQSDGPAYPLTGAAQYAERLLEADPADAAAWNQTKLDALQVGLKVAS